IGKRGIEADGQMVASEDGDPPDVAFRSATTAYHPRVARDASAERPPVPRRIMADEPRPAPETALEESASRPSPRRQIEVYSPPGSHGAILKPEARTPRAAQRAEAVEPTGTVTPAPPAPTDTLRSRIRSEDR